MAGVGSLRQLRAVASNGGGPPDSKAQAPALADRKPQSLEPPQPSVPPALSKAVGRGHQDVDLARSLGCGASAIQQFGASRPRDLPGVDDGHVEEAFSHIDFDGNGFVGVGELRYLLVVMGERPTDAELDEMISMIDTRGDGQVSLADFRMLFATEHPVFRQMTTYGPQQDRVVREHSDSDSEGEFTDAQKKILATSVDAIEHGVIMSKFNREMAEAAQRRGADRMPPLPVSRRQMRAEMDMLAQQDRLGRTKKTYRIPFQDQVTRKKGGMFQKVSSKVVSVSSMEKDKEKAAKKEASGPMKGDPSQKTHGRTMVKQSRASTAVSMLLEDSQIPQFDESAQKRNSMTETTGDGVKRVDIVSEMMASGKKGD